MLFRAIRILSAASLTIAAILALSASRSVASSTEVFEMKDDCNPATFNAAPPVGPGLGNICQGRGETTFAEFVAQLRAERVADEWVFDPDETGLDVGTRFVVVNVGGETHSFTHVLQFGGGIVPFLNQLSGNTTPAVLVPNENPHFLPAGGSQSGFVVARGVQRYQCLIHPWMRSVINGGD